MSIRFILPLVTVSILSSCVSKPALDSQERTLASVLPMGNQIMAFTSDGCSSFPDGIPYYDDRMWLRCCVVHDVAYWQGGTAAQRDQADADFHVCLTKVGGAALAETMVSAVRGGGSTYLPMSWRWGYGWLQNRGYKELSLEEQNQVQEKMRDIPTNLDEVPIISAPVFANRGSLTKDYCLDEGIQKIQEFLGRSFEMTSKAETDRESGMGFGKTIHIGVDGCAEPFEVSFLLLKRHACTAPTNEFVARQRVRFQSLKTPLRCR